MKVNKKERIYTTFNKVPTKRGKKAGNNKINANFDPSMFIEGLLGLDTNNFGCGKRRF